MEKIQLTLTGRQHGEDGEELVIENNAAAEYYEKNGSRYILYEETQEDTGARTKNTIKLRGNILELTKRGSFTTRMVFEPGKEYCTNYATPYGCLKMEIATRAVDAAFHDGKMKIKIDYILSSGGCFLSHCFLDIEGIKK